MASIRKRDGRWRVQVRKRGYKPQFASFTQKSEATAWARQLESEMDRGVFVSRQEAERTTLGELFNRYQSEITPGKASARRERQRLKQLRKEFGHRYVGQLRSQEIASYRDQRLACGLAAATVAKELATLAHVIDTGRREWGIHLPENPVRLVKRPRTAPGRDRRLLPGEEEKLLAACQASRSAALPVLVRLAIETAMRLSELLALEWRHVDLDRRVAFLPHTKNGHSRSVPLSPAAVDLLASWPRSLTGRVFPQWSRPDSVENVWRRAVARAGMAKTLRRSYVTPNGLADYDLEHRLRDYAWLRQCWEFEHARNNPWVRYGVSLARLFEKSRKGHIFSEEVIEGWVPKDSPYWN